MEKETTFFSKRFFIWCFIILALIIVLPTCVVQCTRVDSAEVGIKFNKLSVNKQGALDATTCTGYTFYCPITTDVYTYETRVRQVDYKPFTVRTKDGSKFSMDPKLSYYLIRGMAIQVFAKYRRPLEEIEVTYMKTAVYDAYRINANKYTADELMSNQAKFEADVKLMLDSTLESKGFCVDQFTSKIDPPASLADMIDAKNAAVQSALKAENEIKKAEADAKIAIAKAEGEAKAMKVKADAEAYYNRTIAASLSQQVIELKRLEKWDGKYPYYYGGNGSFLFNGK